MEHKVSLFLTICQGIVLFLVIGVSSDPVVQIQNTEIRGKEIVFEGKGVHEFLGMPYAKPPVGDRRFKKTESLGSFPDYIDASYQAPACRQYTETPFPWYFNDPYKSEDCLYLNIWTPANSSPQNPKPVMVFVHSGNWKFGSNSLDYYSGVPLCALSDIVVVTFNYRLGVFGFLSSNTDEAPGNAGLYDIKELLEWLKKYIIYFKGDPSQITIAGHSSSATAVGYFTLNDDTQDLYSRMIMESGSPVNFQTDYVKQNTDLGKKMAKSVGCKEDDWDTFGPSTIQCLKNVPEDDLEMAEYKLGPNSTAGFHPITGDDFLPNNPRKSILNGNFHCKTLLIGNTRDEGSIILPLLDMGSYGFFGEKDFEVTGKTVQKTLSKIWNQFPDTRILSGIPNLPGALSPPAIASVTNNPLLSNLPDPKSAVTVPVPVDKLPDGILDIVSSLLSSILGTTNPNCMRHQLFSAVGDITLLCPSKYFAEKCAEQGNDVYYYYFIHRPSNSRFAPWMGVSHFSELQFVFGKPLMNPDDFTVEERDMSRQMIQYWGEFAKSGKPDPSWPKYTKEDPMYKVLGGKNGTKPYGKGPHKMNCGLLNKLYNIL